jgi:hypothetical protein
MQSQRKNQILALLFLCFSGCSLHFTKPGLTQQEFKRDWTECQALMGQARASGLIQQREFLRDCMEGRGYTERE